ncbi:MAG: tripartite tricarboxylate transporter substrate binding protein [Burkholderiaceae bacterium]
MRLNPSLGIRRRLLEAAAVAPLAGAGIARAQPTFPTKPVRIVVPYPPGGAVDLGIRALADPLQGILRQQIVVENKPGGVFTVAINSLAQAPADGHVVLATNASFVSAQLTQKLYDMNRQLMPVTPWSRVDTILTASPDAPFNGIGEMIAWARANPGKLNYGAPGGLGTMEHLKVLEACRRYGFDGTAIPFKGGPDAMIALARGDVHLCAAVVPLVNQYKGKVRPLAVLGDRRSQFLPELPTLKEVAVELAPFLFWNGLAVAPATPRSAIETLQDAVAKALLSREITAKFDFIGMTPLASSSSEFGEMIAADFRNFGELVRQAGLNPP